MLTAALEDIPRSQFNHSFDYEHQLVRRLQSPGEQASLQSVSCMCFNLLVLQDIVEDHVCEEISVIGTCTQGLNPFGG